MTLNFGFLKSLFKNSEELGLGMTGLKIKDIEMKRLLAATTADETDQDATGGVEIELQNSSGNLEPGTYFIIGNMTGDAFRDLANGRAGFAIWLTEDGVKINGSYREDQRRETAGNDQAQTITTCMVHSFDGTKQLGFKVEPQGDYVDAPVLHGSSLVWIKLSEDY